MNANVMGNMSGDKTIVVNKKEEKGMKYEVNKAVLPLVMKANPYAEIDGNKVYDIIKGYYVFKPEYVDLRTQDERFDETTGKFTESSIDVVRASETIMSSICSSGDRFFEVIGLAFGSGDDKDEEVVRVKDVLCEQGLEDGEKPKGMAIPLSAFEKVGITPNGTQIKINDDMYVVYRVAIQSASENRQCKATFTSLEWNEFVRSISGNANCLYAATKNAVKAIKYLGLAKTGGRVITGLDFTILRTPDGEQEMEFDAACYYEKENEFKRMIKKVIHEYTDGMGWILPRLAKILAQKLGLKRIPSAFQVRFGQVKGILLVFDYEKYTEGRITQDVIFTKSMWKEDFDVTKAEFLVANLSKAPTDYCVWNYQMFCSLNAQLTKDDINPYVNAVKEYMRKATTTIENAMAFLNIASGNDVDEDTGEWVEDKDFDSVARCLRANPAWFSEKACKYGILKKIKTMSEKMLRGKVPMPDSSILMFGSDPFAFFNALREDTSVNGENGVEGSGKDLKYRFNFNTGDFVVNSNTICRELQAGEFYANNYSGKMLGMRTPLTHWAQIREFNCISLDEERREWLKYLGDMMIFNTKDCTILGMAGADKDGDFGFFTKLFTDKFKQSSYIIYNDNGGKGKDAEILTHEVLARQVRINLVRNQLGMIVNANTQIQELLNDEKALKTFVALVGYEGDRYDFN